MPLDIQHNKKYGFIETTLRGPITTSDMYEAFIQRVSLQEVSGATKVLIDCSEITSGPSAFEVLELPKEIYEKHSVNRQTEMAVIMPKTRELKELAAFFEAASFNCGWMVQVFESRQAAVAWLIKDRPADTELPPEN